MEKEMQTPVYDFVESYRERGCVRAHMPGHKGIGRLGVEDRDITEIDGADVLSQAAGILQQSQENAARLFGAAATLYSAEGSSLAIRAMLYAALLRAGKRVHTDGGSEKKPQRPVILAARNVHRSMMDACALLDLDVEFLESTQAQGICSAVTEPSALERGLDRCRGRILLGVYVTSPDYLGMQCDIRALAHLCHHRDTILMVDNAHGAYLAFLRENEHPMALGADMCCDSAHKTLPVLTGGAYLHLHASVFREMTEDAQKGMALFGSTSPSYLILQSLDLCNAYLAGTYAQELEDCVRRVRQFRKAAACAGLEIWETEPLKLVIHTAVSGYPGTEIAQELRDSGGETSGGRRGVECEYADRQVVVLMVTPQNPPEDWETLYRWLEETELRKVRPALAPPPELCEMSSQRVMSIREAVMAASEKIPARCALGRVLAQETVSCPPAIPIAVSGERITERSIALFQYYGVEEVSVVLEG